MRLVKVLGISVVSLIACSVFAVAQESPKVRAAIEQELARQQADVPLTLCIKSFGKVKNPGKDTAALMEALEYVTAYEQSFVLASSTEEIRALAKKLNGPLPVPWNTYRGNSLIEIFDNYVPDNHGKPSLTLIEYYVKLYTLPEDTIRLAHQREGQLPEYFMQASRALGKEIFLMQKKNTKQIVELLASLAEQYNKLHAQDKDMAGTLWKHFFKMPMPTGWQKVTSVDQLRTKYLLFIAGAGDYVRSYTVEELVEKYQITPEQAEQIVNFSTHYYN